MGRERETWSSARPFFCILQLLLLGFWQRAVFMLLYLVFLFWEDRPNPSLDALTVLTVFWAGPASSEAERGACACGSVHRSRSLGTDEDRGSLEAVARIERETRDGQ